MNRFRWLVCLLVISVAGSAQAGESLWIEAEDLRPIRGHYFPARRTETRTEGHWALSGPGVAAEWTQGGESGFLSIAAHASDATASASLDVEIPADGAYAVWARYGDWREHPEPFAIVIEQPGRAAWTATYGQAPIIDEDNEMKLYWDWAFVWDQRTAELAKGPARLILNALPGATAPRQLDVIVLTTDPAYRPRIKERPSDPAWTLLDTYRESVPPLAPLARRPAPADLPQAWKIKTWPGKDLVYLWNVGTPKPTDTWLSDKPDRVPVPYSIRDEDVLAEFEKTYAGRTDVPIFGDDRVAPAFHGVGPSVFKTDRQTGELTDEGQRFARWLDANPNRLFGGMMNYYPDDRDVIGPKGAETFARYRDRYVGSISGESLGYYYPNPDEMRQATANATTRRQLVEAMTPILLRENLNKYQKPFPGAYNTPEEAYSDVISCLSVGNITFAPLLADWGCRTIGYESAAICSSILSMRWAFMRGIARQRSLMTATYRSCNFGDSATIFSKASSYTTPQAVVDNFYSVFSGAGMTWYKFDIWYQYMAGSAIFYHEQGFDEYWIPGGTVFGRHGLDLSPKGKLVDRFLRLTKENFDRGSPYTPVALLVDYAHGWEPATNWPNAFENYPQRQDAFPRDDHDAMMNAYMWVAFHPIGRQSEKPITSTAEVFVPGVFGDIFDVIAAYPDVNNWTTLDTYPVVIGVGELELTEAEGQRLAQYVQNGGTLVIAEGQVTGPGVRALALPGAPDLKEAAGYRWMDEPDLNSSGRFRYRPIDAAAGLTLAATPDGDAFCVAIDRGQGRLIYLSVPLGLTIGKQAHPVVARIFAHVTRGLMPIEVEGDVTWLVNRNAAGWMVTLLNPAGQAKPQHGITPTDFRENRTVTIISHVPVQTAVDKLLPTDRLEVRDGRVTFEVPAGAVRIIELR